MSEAFAGEPYINALFPHHGTPEGRVIGGKRLLEAKKADPAARFLKITDTATDEIVGLVKWLVFEKPPGEKSPEEPELTGDYWDTEEEKEYAAYMYKQYLIPRRKAIREAKGPLV
ncbi:hypothetical protein MMC13_001280, partial [Lambiella insularis]|nr:hypothetical protein [Lambiella insularis]